MPVNLQFIIDCYNTVQRKKVFKMYRLQRFLQGRYGADKLFYFMASICILLSFVNIFVRSLILQLVVYGILILSFVRIMSRNTEKRSEENRKFCAVWDKVAGKFRLIKRMWTDRKTHSYVHCPHCKKVLRLPKKKGVHTTKCPNCLYTFQVKI